VKKSSEMPKFVLAIRTTGVHIKIYACEAIAPANTRNLLGHWRDRHPATEPLLGLLIRLVLSDHPLWWWSIEIPCPRIYLIRGSYEFYI
jgi:hypothetical protein